MNQRTKLILRELLRLIGALAVIAGMGLTILTAAGIEQDVLSGSRLIVWILFSVGLMAAGGLISTYGKEEEDDGYGSI